MKNFNSGLDTIKLCQLAVLVAIEIIMSLTPLGFLNLGVLSASLLSIPVAIGAIILGPKESTVLGLVFGICSFCKGFTTTSVMTLAMYAYSLPYSFIVAVGGRVLMGLCTGLLVVIVRKLVNNAKTIDCFIGSLAAPLLNTCFFMGLLMLLFYRSDYVQGLCVQFGVRNPVLLIVSMVGVQALIEACTCAVIATAVSKALKVALKRI